MGDGVHNFPGISEGVPSVEDGWDGQTGNHIKPNHGTRDLWEPAFLLCMLGMWLSPHFYLISPSVKGLLAPYFLYAFRCGKGVFAQPHL